jgi:uncharacterized DUF497 family protein
MLKLRFEWDLVKAEANRTKHGIAFEDAITATVADRGRGHWRARPAKCIG